MELRRRVELSLKFVKTKRDEIFERLNKIKSKGDHDLGDAALDFIEAGKFINQADRDFEAGHFDKTRLNIEKAERYLKSTDNLLQQAAQNQK